MGWEWRVFFQAVHRPPPSALSSSTGPTLPSLTSPQTLRSLVQGLSTMEGNSRAELLLLQQQQAARSLAQDAIEIRRDVYIAIPVEHGGRFIGIKLRSADDNHKQHETLEVKYIAELLPPPPQRTALVHDGAPTHSPTHDFNDSIRGGPQQQRGVGQQDEESCKHHKSPPPLSVARWVKTKVKVKKGWVEDHGEIAAALGELLLLLPNQQQPRNVSSAAAAAEVKKQEGSVPSNIDGIGRAVRWLDQCRLIVTPSSASSLPPFSSVLVSVEKRRRGASIYGLTFEETDVRLTRLRRRGSGPPPPPKQQPTTTSSTGRTDTTNEDAQRTTEESGVELWRSWSFESASSHTALCSLAARAETFFQQLDGIRAIFVSYPELISRFGNLSSVGSV